MALSVQARALRRLALPGRPTARGKFVAQHHHQQDARDLGLSHDNYSSRCAILGSSNAIQRGSVTTPSFQNIQYDSSVPFSFVFFRRYINSTTVPHCTVPYRTTVCSYVADPGTTQTIYTVVVRVFAFDEAKKAGRRTADCCVLLLPCPRAYSRRAITWYVFKVLTFYYK